MRLMRSGGDRLIPRRPRLRKITLCGYLYMRHIYVNFDRDLDEIEALREMRAHPGAMTAYLSAQDVTDVDFSTMPTVAKLRTVRIES